MTDYGFAPGPTAQDGLLRGFFRRRADTVLVPPPGAVGTVQQFVNFLEVDNSVALPISDVVLGSHANEFSLFLPFFQGQGTPTTYEVVEQGIASSAMSVEFPPNLFNDDPTIRTFIHIKGCNVGKSQPFMNLLALAFGTQATGATVTAPKHFHGLQLVPGEGMYEYMAYQFRVFAHPTRRAQSRAELVGWFQAAAREAEQRQDPNEFRLIDGTYVDSTAFEQWVPTRFQTTNNNLRRAYNLAFASTETVGNRSTLSITTEYSVAIRPTQSWTISGSVLPVTDADRLAELESGMRASPEMQESHPFPTYLRHGYRDFDSFFQGQNWDFVVGTHEGAPVLLVTGSHVEYGLQIPIESSGFLAFNFYPDNGSGFPTIIRMLENNPGFFGIS